MSREEVLASLLIAELRFISKDRLKLVFELVADVDHKARPDVVVKGRVDALDRPVGAERAARSIGSRTAKVRGPRSEVELRQSRQKASLVSQNRGRVMIRMPPLPVRQNNHARLGLANHRSNFQPVLPCVLNAPVGNIECASPLHAENLRCIVRLTFAVVSRAARAHLPTREIENACFLPALCCLQQSSPTSLLYVIAVCGNCQNVDLRRHCSRSLPSGLPTHSHYFP